MSAVVLPLVEVEGLRCADERQRRWAEARLVLEGAGQGSGAGLPVAVGDWPVIWQENLAERTAIMAICGGLPVQLAERRAEERVRAEYAREQGLLAERVNGVAAETASLSH